MGSRRRHCQSVAGAILCGGPATAEDLAEVERFRRYRSGDMSPAERLAYTSMGGGEPTDLGRVAQIEEIREGHGTFRHAREAAGLSVGQTARLTGWPRARVVELEAGEAPTPEERATLCELFDVAGFVDASGALPHGLPALGETGGDRG